MTGELLVAGMLTAMYSLLASAVRIAGGVMAGYSIEFVVFVFLALMSLGVAWVLKYGPAVAAAADKEQPRVQPSR